MERLYSSIKNNNRSAEWAAEQLGSAEFLEVRAGASMGAHQMRDGVTLNQYVKEQRLALGSEIRHLKKREAFYGDCWWLASD